MKKHGKTRKWEKKEKGQEPRKRERRKFKPKSGGEKLQLQKKKATCDRRICYVVFSKGYRLVSKMSARDMGGDMDRNRLAYSLRKPENSDLKEEYSKMSRDGKRKFLEAFKQVHFKAEELRVQRRVVTAVTNARVEKETFLTGEQLESALGSKERARR